MIFKKSLNNLSAYTAGKTMQEVKEEYGLDTIIKLNANENPYGATNKIIENISNINKVSVYPDSEILELRRAIAKENNLEIDNVIVGNGGDEIIGLISNVMLDKSDEIIMCTPGFSMYKIMAITENANVIEVPLKDFKTDLNEFLKAVTKKTKLIYITNPHNPTGTIVSKDELENFMDKVPENILVVIDEAYAEYISSDEFSNSVEELKKYDNICVLRTFSKAYGLAGLRVGYLLANKELIDEINKIRPPYNVNVLSQMAGRIALEEKDWMMQCVEKNKNVMNIVCKILDENNIKYAKSETNFLFIDTTIDSNIVNEKLLKKGFLVRAGYKNEYKTFIRVSMGLEEQMKKFTKELIKIIKEG